MCRHWKWMVGSALSLATLAVTIRGTEVLSTAYAWAAVSASGMLSLLLLVCLALALGRGYRTRSLRKAERTRAIGIELTRLGETLQVWIAEADRLHGLDSHPTSNQARFANWADMINKDSVLKRYLERKPKVLRWLSEARQLGFRVSHVEEMAESVSGIVDLRDFGVELQNLGTEMQERSLKH